MAEQTTQLPQQQSHQSIPALSEPDPVRRPARLALYVGGASILLGMLAMYLGYDGAAKNPVPAAQTPYVISGGLLGLGLMALGGVAIAVYILLQAQADLRTDLSGLRDSMDRLSEAIAHEAFSSAARSSSGPSANGTVVVARGAASYHRPDCRLVTRAEHASPVPRTEAERNGLIPCRICKP